MGILDKVSSLLPWRRERSEPPPAHAQAFALREDLDHWLQGLLGEPRVFPAIPDLAWMPSADVRETDDEVVVTAEVPGSTSPSPPRVCSFAGRRKKPRPKIAGAIGASRSAATGASSGWCPCRGGSISTAPTPASGTAS